MVDPGVYLGVKTSLDSITSSFEKLESLHFGMLKQQDSLEGKSHRRNNSTSAALKNNNTRGPTPFSTLESLKKEHSNGIKNLKNLLLGNHQQDMSKNNSLETCKKTLGVSISNLREKLLKMNNFELTEKSLLPHFNLVTSDIDRVFQQIQKITGKENLGKMKELWDSSNETYAQVEKVATSLKKKVVSTFKLTTNLSLSYEKESDLQKENLNKIRSYLSRMSEKTNILSAKEGSDLKKSLGKIDELIKETILRDSNKNKLYKDAKEHNEKTYKKMMMSLKDILSPVEESHQFLETLSPVLEFKDSPRRSPRPVLTTSKSTPRLNSTKDILREDSSPLLSFKHSPKKWDVRDDISSFLLNRSQTPNSTSGGVKLESKVQHRKLHGRLASAHSISTKELRLENSLNKATHQQENPQDLSKMISCVKVYGKNFIDAANRIKDVSLRGEKPRDLFIRNFEECENAFENQLNELSEKTSQMMKTGTIASPIFSLESFYARGHNSLLSSPTGYNPLEPFLDDLTRGNEKNGRVKVLVDKYEQIHGSVDLRGSQASTAFPEGSKKASATFSQSSPDGFFGRSSSLAETPNLLQTKSQANFNREGQNFNEMNEILIQENQKLLKVIKKLQSKSEERKNNLKEVFKLLTNKDEELRQLKAQAQVESSLYMIKFEEIFKLAEQKLKEKYLSVEENLIHHENKLQNIEARLFTYKGGTQGSARTMNNEDTEPQEYNKTIGYGDSESLLETIKYLESHIHSLTKEKKEFEEKCNLLIKDLELIQEHKKKLEINYQEELLVQNEKIVQITGYAEGLELKYNKRVKEQITPIKQRRSASVKPEGERNNRDMIDSEHLVEQISKKLQNVCQKLGFEKFLCENMGPLEKISKIQEGIKKLKRQEGSEDSSGIIQKSRDEPQDLTKFCAEILDILRDYSMVIFEESLNWNPEKVLKKLNFLLKESSERKLKIQEFELKSKSKVSPLELEDLGKKLGNKEKEIVRLTQELETRKGRVSELERKVESKLHEIEKLNVLNSEFKENEAQNNNHTKKKLKEADELVKSKLHEIERLISLNSELKEKNIKLEKSQNEHEIEKFNLLNSEFEKLSSLNSELQGNSQRLQKQVKELQDNNLKSNELMKSKQREIERLSSEIIELQGVKLKQGEIEKLQENNFRLQKEVMEQKVQKEREIERLNSVITELQGVDEMVKLKQGEIEKLRSINSELKEKNAKLEKSHDEEFHEKQREIEKLNSVNTELQENKIRLQRELENNNIKLKGDSDELHNQIDKLTAEIIVLERNQLELQETINKKNAVYAQLKRDFDELKLSLDGQNKNILMENQNLGEEKRKIENQLRNLKEEKAQTVLKLENENQELVQKMNSLLSAQEQYKRDLSLKSESLELQIAELNKNLQKKDSTLKSKTTEIEEARSINKHLTSQNHQQIVLVAESESKLAQLRGELKSTQEQVQKLEKMNQEQKLKIEGNLSFVKNLEGDCRELKEELKKRQNKLASVSEEVKVLKDENLRLKFSESELLLVKETLLAKETQTMNLSNEIKILSESHDQLKQEIKQKNMEECEMKQELEMERDASSKLKEELNQVNAYLKSLEEGKISTEQQLLLKKKVDDLIADKENVRSHLGVLEVKLKERQTTIEKLKLEMQELSTNLQDKLNDKEKQIVILEAEVGRKADLSNLMTERFNEIEKDHQKLSEINKNLSKERGLLVESQEDFGKSLISLIQSLDNTRDSLTTNNLENLKILEAKISKITQNLQKASEDVKILNLKVETQKKEAEQRIQDEKKKGIDLQKSIESELFLQREENQKLSLELQAFKEERLQGDNFLHQVKSIQSVEISPQLQAITPDDDRSQETENGTELKKAKSLCHQEFELAVKRRGEIDDLSLVTRDRQRSVASKNVTFRVDDDKSQEDYEKRLEGLRKEIETLQVKKTELEKEPESLRLELGKVKSELLELRKSLKDRGSFELSPEPMKVFTFKEGESSDKVEKLRNDNKRLREHRQLIKDENDELRKSFANFQVQIVNLSEKIKNSSGEKKDENEVIEAMRESLVTICALETLQGRLDIKLGNKKEVQDTMAVIKQAFEENEEDIVALVKELEDYDKKKAEYEKQRTQFEIIKDRLIEGEVEAKAKIDQANEILREEKKRLNEEIEFYENTLYDKLSKINHVIEGLIRENNIADLSEIVEERIMNEGFVYLEDLIYKNIGTLKELVVMAAEIQDNYEKLVDSKRKPKASIQDDIIDKAGSIEREDLGESGPETGDFSNKIQTIDEVRRILTAKDGRTATFGEQPIVMTEDEARSPTFQNLNDQDIESNESRTNKNLDHANVSEIKTLYDQIRSLQDENEKLQIENKQLDNDFTLLKFTCDELKADIMDKEEQMRNRLPEDLPSFGEPKVSAEKEHIKAIFLKFMHSAFLGEKESALELLRLILNLMQASENDQTKIIEEFKQSCSSSKKGGVFKKLFKK